MDWLISLQSKGLSRVSQTPQFKSINSSALSFHRVPVFNSHFSAEETEVQGVVPSRKLAAAWDGSGSASFPTHQLDFTSQFNLARHSLVRPPPGPPCSSSELLCH